jgi:hypothetical protein
MLQEHVDLQKHIVRIYVGHSPIVPQEQIDLDMNLIQGHFR